MMVPSLVLGAVAVFCLTIAAWLNALADTKSRATYRQFPATALMLTLVALSYLGVLLWGFVSAKPRTWYMVGSSGNQKEVDAAILLFLVLGIAMTLVGVRRLLRLRSPVE
jgi:hypothetical protein